MISDTAFYKGFKVDEDERFRKIPKKTETSY